MSTSYLEYSISACLGSEGGKPNEDGIISAQQKEPLKGEADSKKENERIWSYGRCQSQGLLTTVVILAVGIKSRFLSRLYKKSRWVERDEGLRTTIG